MGITQIDPKWLTILPKLERLDLRGNPLLKRPPRGKFKPVTAEVADRATQNASDYLKALEASEKVYKDATNRRNTAVIDFNQAIENNENAVTKEEKGFAARDIKKAKESLRKLESQNFNLPFRACLEKVYIGNVNHTSTSAKNIPYQMLLRLKEIIWDDNAVPSWNAVVLTATVN